MDLDELKAGWHKEINKYSQINKKDMEQLQIMLKEKTSATLGRVSKKFERIISMIFIGIALNVLISPFLHWILGDGKPVFRITFGGLVSLITVVIMLLAVVFFYWIKYTSFSSKEINDDLKQTLLNNIKKLKKSLRHEIYFFSAFFLIFFILGRGVSQFLGNGNFEDIFHPDIMLSILAGALMLCMLLFFRTKQYRRNIKELEKYLHEFEESEGNK